MLDDGPAQAHGLGRGALLHAFQRGVVKMAFQGALRSHRAARLEHTAAAYLRLPAIDDDSIPPIQLAAHQSLSRGTAVAIAGFIVVELAAVKQLATARSIYTPLGRKELDVPWGKAANSFTLTTARAWNTISQLRLGSLPCRHSETVP
jgi:hypothetical protein